VYRSRKEIGAPAGECVYCLDGSLLIDMGSADDVANGVGRAADDMSALGFNSVPEGRHSPASEPEMHLPHGNDR
jgi:hypothetical protein